MEKLVNKNLQVGLAFDSSYDTWAYGIIKTNRGEFIDAYPLINKLEKIASDYEFTPATRGHSCVELEYLITIRHLTDAQKTIKKYISLNLDHSDQITITFLCLQAQLQILLKDYAEADKTISQLEVLVSKQDLLMPSFVAHFF